MEIIIRLYYEVAGRAAGGDFQFLLSRPGPGPGPGQEDEDRMRN